MKKSLIVLLVFIVALAAGRAAYSQSAQPYVIGFSAAQSGPISFIGKGLADGINAYLKGVNAHGGVKGHEVQFFPLDDQANATTAVANFKELVGIHHASVVLGWSLSNTVAATLPIATQMKGAMIGQAMTPESLAVPDGVGFGGDVLIPSMATPELQFATERLAKAGGAPKVAVIDMDSAAQRELQSRLLAGAKAKGWNVVSTQFVPLSTTDMTNYVVAIKSAAPDFVIGSVDGTRVVMLMRAMHTLNASLPFVNFTGGSDLGPLDAVREPSLYAMSAFAYPTDPTPVAQRFNDDMKAIGAEPNESYAMHGYTQAYVAVKVLERCGYPCSNEAYLRTMQTFGTMPTNSLTVAPLEYSTKYHGGFKFVRFFHWDPARGRPTPVSDLISVTE